MFEDQTNEMLRIGLVKLPSALVAGVHASAKTLRHTPHASI